MACIRPLLFWLRLRCIIVSTSAPKPIHIPFPGGLVYGLGEPEAYAVSSSLEGCMDGQIARNVQIVPGGSPPRPDRVVSRSMSLCFLIISQGQCQPQRDMTPTGFYLTYDDRVESPKGIGQPDCVAVNSIGDHSHGNGFHFAGEARSTRDDLWLGSLGLCIIRAPSGMVLFEMPRLFFVCFHRGVH